jgi:hypothetical protein
MALVVTCIPLARLVFQSSSYLLASLFRGEEGLCHDVLLEELCEALKPLILQYQQLTHKDLDDFYDGDTGTLGPKYMLDVMNSFHQLTLIMQFRQIHWRCPCTWGSDIWLVTTQPCSQPFGSPTYVFRATCLRSLFSSAKARQYPQYSITTRFSMMWSASINRSGNPRSQASTTPSRLCQRQRGGKGPLRRARHSQIMARARHSPSQTMTTSRLRQMLRMELRDGGASSISQLVRPSSRYCLLRCTL